MANKRIINLETGEDVIVPLTPEEEAEAIARSDAEANDPVRLQQAADAVERADAKSVAALAYLANHTNAEIRTFIESNINVSAVTDLASARQCLGRISNMVEHLAVGLAVIVRKELR